MIKSLEELAESRDFDIARYGDKTVRLAEFIVDRYEQDFICHKPSGYVVDTGDVDEALLRETFERLVSEIDTSIGERKVGAIYCRSSAPGEYPGSNESIPVLYDESNPEQSWVDFQEAFMGVREQEYIKPVLLQNLVGEITPEKIIVTRKVHEYDWPGLPGGKRPEDMVVSDIPEYQSLTVQAVLEAMKKEGFELPEEMSSSNPSMSLVLYVENGPIIDTLTVSNMWELQSNACCARSVLFTMGNGRIEEQGYSRNDNNEFLDESGDVVLKKGTKVSLGVVETETEHVIGQTNTAFVARSRDYLEPDMASVKRTWGLTSYLMGSNKDSGLLLRSMMIEYFDSETGEVKETVNLGHDFRYSSKSYYRQSVYEGFSIRNKEIELRRDSAFVESPHEISKDVLRIARFYQDKLGVEVELEGCIKNGGLHILQITESSIPEDVIFHLTEVSKEQVLYGTDFGRGSINHLGHVVIREDDGCQGVTAELDRQGIPYLILGFDDGVTLEKKFLYMATDKSICDDVFELSGGHRRGFSRLCLGQHKEGIACQTIVNAVQNGRQGGMFYVNPDTLMDGLRDYIEEIDGVKVIRDVCVEACRDGMQIYKPS